MLSARDTVGCLISHPSPCAHKGLSAAAREVIHSHSSQLLPRAQAIPSGQSRAGHQPCQDQLCNLLLRGFSISSCSAFSIHSLPTAGQKPLQHWSCSAFPGEEWFRHNATAFVTFLYFSLLQIIFHDGATPNGSNDLPATLLSKVRVSIKRIFARRAPAQVRRVPESPLTLLGSHPVLPVGSQ